MDTEIYRSFLSRELSGKARMNQGQIDAILGKFDKITSTGASGETAFTVVHEAYGNSDTPTAIQKIEAMIETSSASTNCANALPPIGQAIYRALKNNKSTIKDDDKRKWKGLTELDCDIHNDTRLRVNLWQWQETFNKDGLIERKQILRSAIASERDNAGLELTVLY